MSSITICQIEKPVPVPPTLGQFTINSIIFQPKNGEFSQPYRWREDSLKANLMSVAGGEKTVSPTDMKQSTHY